MDQIIEKIIIIVDNAFISGADGFYRGELDGRIGYVPCNVVSEIPDPNIRPGTTDRQQVVNSNLTSKTTTVRGRQNLLQSQNPANPVMMQQQQQLPTGSTATPVEQWQHQPEQISVKKMIALYDYDPQENSPNADTEVRQLTFDCMHQ